VGCINEVTRRIAAAVGGVPIMHGQGCGQLPSDMADVRRVLAGIASSPNVGAAIVVGLGCEGVPPDGLAADIAMTGRPVETVVLQEIGGYTKAVAKGIEVGLKMKADLASCERVEADVTSLTVGVKCGASDTTMGLVANPAAGLAADALVAAGATFIFCETTELMGAERRIAARARCPEVADRVIEAVVRIEREVERFGEDMRGGQPTRGNIAGGITTIEEKSLGAICKAGSATVQEVLRYGQRPREKGLYFMDSPGRELEVLAGLASAGAQVIFFTTGLGAPQGFPVVPVVKISANARTVGWLGEHIDVDVSGVLGGTMTLLEASASILSRLQAVASGQATRAEELGFDETMDVYVRGPVI
jgi:altronate dehydratase large subunit